MRAPGALENSEIPSLNGTNIEQSFAGYEVRLRCARTKIEGATARSDCVGTWT
jgi:hypothetical protein